MAVGPRFPLLDTSRIAVDHTHPTVPLPGCALFSCTPYTPNEYQAAMGTHCICLRIVKPLSQKSLEICGHYCRSPNI